jgi:hypothetical protein
VHALDEHVGRGDHPAVRCGTTAASSPGPSSTDEESPGGDDALDQAELAELACCSVRHSVSLPEGSPPCRSRPTSSSRTEVGKAAAVADAIAALDGVAQAEDVTGPYDVIVRAEANSVDELGKLVVARIQGVDGITRTLTCPVVHL